jgi:predicted PurR-regulated permease PerM
MNRFFLGLLTALSATAAVFFLKFWKESKDRLFAFFAAAFGILAVDWLVRALVNPRHESQHYLYLIRLLAFLLIIAGIADKNRSRS